MLGVGTGGTAEKTMPLAKKALMEPIDIQDLIAHGPSNHAEELRVELYEKVSTLGVGAQGLDGLATVLDVKILGYPTYAANLPVAMIPNCAATRHTHFTLDSSGVAKLEVPDLSQWSRVEWAPDTETSKHVDPNALTPEEVASQKPSQTLLLNGKMPIGRDAVHKRIADMLAKGEKLPIGLANRVTYYIDPVDPVRGEVVGPAGPTMVTRMDKFTETMLAQAGLIAVVGKIEHGLVAIEPIKKHKSAYLIVVGDTAHLASKAIRGSKILAFEDLGMEAIYEFDARDIPVVVAMDSLGTSVHKIDPVEWQAKIGKISVAASRSVYSRPI